MLIQGRDLTTVKDARVCVRQGGIGGVNTGVWVWGWVGG